MGKGRSPRRAQLGNYWLWYRADRDDWAICWLHGRTVRRRSLGIGGGSRDHPPEEALTALADHFRQNEQSSIYQAAPDKVLVQDITRQWLTQHVAHLADPTRYAFSIIALERFYAEQARQGKMPEPFTVATVRSHLVRDFIAFRQAEGASPPTISRDIAALRGPINWALGENILASAPRIPDVVGRSKSKDLVYGPEQVARLLEASVGRQDREHLFIYILTMLSTLSRSEAVLCFDLDTQLRNGLLYFNPPGRQQTPKRRAIVPVAPTLAPWLDGRSGRLIQYKVPYSEKNRAEGFPDFLVRNVSDIGRAFEAALIEAGKMHPHLQLSAAVQKDGKDLWLPPRRKLGETEPRQVFKGIGTPNTLRHTIHTFLSAKGIPKAQIDTAAGHSTDGGTGDKYNHLRPEYMSEFIEGIELFWSEVSKFTDVHTVKGGKHEA